MSASAIRTAGVLDLRPAAWSRFLAVYVETLAPFCGVFVVTLSVRVLLADVTSYVFY